MSDELKGELRIDGDKLRVIAKRQGMTLTTLAGAMGMHYNSILRIVNEGTTSLSTLEELCNVLSCNPLDLLVWDHFAPIDPNSAALVAVLSRLGIEPTELAKLAAS